MLKHVSRRSVLAGSALAVAASCLARAQSGSGPVRLAIEPYLQQLLEAGPKSSIWRYVTDSELPMLRARQGQPFEVQITNALDVDHELHFFGVRSAAGTTTVVVPAKTALPVSMTFTPVDAGTFWFGPLRDASRQRDMGLSGIFIVEESSPLENFIDTPLIFDDWIIDESGKLDQDFGNLEAAIAEGRLGNWFTVNGQFKPRIKVDRSKNNRLRLINVSNTRTFNIALKNTDANLLALDGQAVPMAPVGNEALVLLPGQRMDLLLSNIGDQVVVSADLFEDVVEVAFLIAEGQAGEGVPDNFVLPSNMITPLGPQLRVVSLRLEGGAKGGLKAARVGSETLDLRGMLERGLAWAINGISGPGGPPVFEVVKGESVILEIENLTGFAQPLHIQGHFWQERDDENLDSEAGVWRDTALIPAKATKRFGFVAENPGQWLIHSLIAERHDSGLMANFVVQDMP